ncbi:MAG: type II toxin-antitoxin system HicA family toxin [Candidatus Angelobacter sp.]
MSQVTPWRDIVRAAEKLGYTMKKSRGALRVFRHSSRQPECFTFHEPHGGQVIYAARVVKRMGVTLDEFLELTQ